jgi:hypothetical protein
MFVSLFQLFGQPRLDQRLVGHVPFVGGNFDPLQKAVGEAERDGGGARFQVWQAHTFGLAPIGMACRISRFPKIITVTVHFNIWNYGITVTVHFNICNIAERIVGRFPFILSQSSRRLKRLYVAHINLALSVPRVVGGLHM